MAVKQNKDGTLKYNNPVRVWRGLITQGGTSAPTIIELENTLETKITGTRMGVGAYLLTAEDDVFKINKTVIITGSTGAIDVIVGGTRTEDNEIQMSSSYGGNAEDNLFLKTGVEIIVYP